MRYAEYIACLSKSIEELDNAALVLIQDAQVLLDQFWLDVKARNEFAPFAFNVSKQKSTYRIRWGKMYRPKSKLGTPKRPMSFDNITMGKNDSYSISQLKGCPAWFEVLFHKYEPQLFDIRKALRTNRNIRGRISKSMSYYKTIWIQC